MLPFAIDWATHKPKLNCRGLCFLPIHPESAEKERVPTAAYLGQHRNLQGCRQTTTVGPRCCYPLRRENGTSSMHRCSPPAAPHEIAWCRPECQLSCKSTHWVSPSNLSNPAGKQHIRPLTALMTAWLRSGILNKERERKKKHALLFYSGNWQQVSHE